MEASRIENDRLTVVYDGRNFDEKKDYEMYLLLTLLFMEYGYKFDGCNFDYEKWEREFRFRKGG